MMTRKGGYWKYNNKNNLQHFQAFIEISHNSINENKTLYADAEEEAQDIISNNDKTPFPRCREERRTKDATAGIDDIGLLCIYSH